MKKITAHFNTGAGLVAQEFEMYDDFNPREIVHENYVELGIPLNRTALVRIADVAFWTYD